MQAIDYPLKELFENGRVHSCGIYYPRQHRNHWNSRWSMAVWNCKHGNLTALEQCAAIMGRLLSFIIGDEPIVITYVPGRADIDVQRWRSRSAAEPLARRIEVLMRTEGFPHVSLASLLRHTRLPAKMQHHCRSLRERRANITGCYQALNSQAAVNQQIIVIDDVLTSGATMRECQRVLLKAGALDVQGLVLARTVGW